jgi:PhnB protein
MILGPVLVSVIDLTDLLGSFALVTTVAAADVRKRLTVDDKFEAAQSASNDSLEVTVTSRSPEVPAGYPKLVPFIVVPNAAEAVEFYGRAFGAIERFRVVAPNGGALHIVLEIGEAVVMLNDFMQVPPPQAGSALGASSFLIFVADVDAAIARAVDAGATLVQPIATLLFGERVGGLADPFGHNWMLATHVEDVAPEDMQRRADESFRGSGPRA